MKKPKLLLTILLVVLLSHCQREKELERCESQLCQDYLQIWEQLLRDRNDLTQGWVDAHIKVTGYEIRSNPSYDIFSIKYKIQVDWATFHTYDQITIRVDSSETLFPGLQIARGPYLTAEDIDEILDIRAFGSEMIDITGPIDHLRFSSKAQAVKELEEATGYRLAFPELFWSGSGLLFPYAGHPMLRATATIDGEANRCLTARIDLVTGYVEFWETSCWID
jgi:hypothetical protein